MSLIVDITTRCNMTCAHCLFARTTDGQDISVETFKKALSMPPVRGVGVLSMGTGEPTIHPKFWELIDIALNDKTGWRVRVVTNGKKTRTALRLAAMARDGVLEAHLSLDKWHDPIKQTVIDAFKKDPSNRRDKRAYRLCDEDDLKNVGRCDFGPEQAPTCRCPVPKVKPDGTVYACGCENAKSIGTVDGWDKKLLRSGYMNLGCDGPAGSRAPDRFFVALSRVTQAGS